MAWLVGCCCSYLVFLALYSFLNLDSGWAWQGATIFASLEILAATYFCIVLYPSRLISICRYGRKDAPGPEACSPEGNLPDGNPGPDGKYGGPGGSASTEATTPNEHLRKVFYRMGLNVCCCVELLISLFGEVCRPSCSSLAMSSKLNSFITQQRTKRLLR